MGEIEIELAGTHPLVRKQITLAGFLMLLLGNFLDSRLVKYLPVLIEMTMGLTSAAQACFAGLEEIEENDLEKIQFVRFLHPRLDYHHHPQKSLVL